MINKVYAILDTKAGFFGTPFFAVNDSVASRQFVTLGNDINSMVNKYPDDYQLYSLGEYDDNSGSVIGYDKPTRLEVVL